MARDMDPQVRRFLEIHSVSVREEVEADIADDRDLSPAERWRILEGLSGTMEWLKRANSPEFAGRALDWRDPPHPSYRDLIARLRER